MLGSSGLSADKRSERLKLSFLIPSKNRLDLLKHAVQSVLDQGDGDIEIVISDNASTEGYREYVESLADPRIVFTRSDEPLTVTENWRRALANSTGDYILMLGDDDALAPNFCREIRKAIADYSAPEVIFLAAYHYAYPKAIAANPTGYLAVVDNAEFLGGADGAFSLTSEYAQDLAHDVLQFRYRIGLNAQHYVLKRSLIDKLAATHGGIYQSPYPDTFAGVLLLTRAQSVVVLPEPLVIIGISPKSFGYYYFSGKHDEGYQFLNNEEVAPEVRQEFADIILPGDRNNTNWLVAAETARRSAGLPASALNVERYRKLQIYAMLRAHYIQQNIAQDEFALFRARLNPAEAEIVDRFAATVAAEGRARASRSLALMVHNAGQYVPPEVKHCAIGPHSDVGDAIAWLRTRDEAATTQPTALSCPFCRHPALPLYKATDWNQDATPKTFAYAKCTKCELTFQNPLPESVADFYVHEQYDVPAPDYDFLPRANTQKWKLDLLPELPGNRMLEIGPATGEFATVARNAGFDITVIEMDGACCDYLRDTLKHDVIQSNDPIASMPDEKFDAICAWQVIEHIPKFWRWIEAAARRLKPGGIIVLATPNPNSFQARALGRYWPHLDAPRHLYLIPTTWYYAMANRSGVRVRSITTLDAGSIGLNNSGWHLFLRNWFGKVLPTRVNHIAAAALSRLFRRWEHAEGLGASYVVVLEKI